MQNRRCYTFAEIFEALKSDKNSIPAANIYFKSISISLTEPVKLNDVFIGDVVRWK
jgi:hypothetical protein